MAHDNIERWLPVEGFPGYEVSDLGRVRSRRPRRRNAPDPTEPREMHAGSDRKGYRRIVLRRGRDGGKQTHFRVHRLVMETFVGPCPEGLQVRHLNGNPADNRIENLRYGTYKENYADSVRHGTAAKGERHGGAVLTVHLVDAIRFAHSLGRFSGKEIAKKLQVSRHSVKALLCGVTWRSRPNPWDRPSPPSNAPRDWDTLRGGRALREDLIERDDGCLFDRVEGED